MKKLFIIILLFSIFIVFNNVFARTGGGSGGRGSTGGRSAATPASPSRSFNPYHQEFNPTIQPGENKNFNNTPFFSPNYIPFNPSGGNDNPKREPMYDYDSNFDGKQY